LLSYLKKKVLVVGCGNPLYGDDGFGIAVVEELKRRGWEHPDVEILDAGTGAPQHVFSLMDEDTETEFVVVADAVDLGLEPGTLVELGPEDLRRTGRCIPVDAHGWPLEDALLDVHERLGIDFVIVGCQVKELPIPDVKPGLSEPVERAVPEAADRIVRMVELYLSEGDIRKR